MDGDTIDWYYMDPGRTYEICSVLAQLLFFSSTIFLHDEQSYHGIHRSMV